MAFSFQNRHYPFKGSSPLAIRSSASNPSSKSLLASCFSIVPLLNSSARASTSLLIWRRRAIWLCRRVTSTRCSVVSLSAWKLRSCSSKTQKSSRLRGECVLDTGDHIIIKDVGFGPGLLQSSQLLLIRLDHAINMPSDRRQHRDRVPVGLLCHSSALLLFFCHSTGLRFRLSIAPAFS